MEILAIAIQNPENIKGITIAGLETKLLQFADDTTAVLSDLDSARALFELLEFFEKASGLTLYVTKTEAMWIGSFQNCENEPLGVKCKTCVQILEEKNFKQRLKKLKHSTSMEVKRIINLREGKYY